MSVRLMGLLLRSDLPAIERLVALSLADYANDEGYSIWPSNATTCARTGLTPATVRRSMKRLKARGILVEDGTHKAGRWVMPQYRIDAVALETTAQREPPSERPPLSVSGHPRSERAAPPLSVSPDPLGNQELEPLERTAAAPLDLVDEHFETFWKIYPRKAAKDAARIAFRRRVHGTKRAPAVSVAAIIEGATRFAADPNLPPPAEERFIPHPTTWLNQGRWQDGPLAPRGKGSAPVSDAQDAILAHLEGRAKQEGDQ